MNAIETAIAKAIPEIFDDYPVVARPISEGKIPEGRRNAHLTSLAGTMRRRGMDQAAIEAALLKVNISDLAAPLDQREVREIAASVGRYQPAATSSETGRTVKLTRASSITVRPVRWLWSERLPLGAFSLIGGREGIGKSTASYTCAADVTRGRLKGAFAGVPKSVIVAATEDSWEHTIVPRLMAADADLERVYRVDVVTSLGTDAGLSLPRDLESVRGAITDVDAALVLLDPLLSRLDASLDTHKDAEVRRALEPLSALADSAGVCVLGLIHVNKSTSNDVLTTLMASRAFAAVARAVLFVMQDPDDEHVRLLGQGKNNLGRMDLPTLAFKIDGCQVADTAEGPVWTGKLEWLGENPRSIRDAMEAAVALSGDRTATSEAADWLADYLSANNGCADAADIKREGAKAGHSKDALRRAKTKLGITSVTAGFPRRASWCLPVDAAVGETTPTATTALTAATDDSLGALGALGALAQRLPA